MTYLKELEDRATNFKREEVRKLLLLCTPEEQAFFNKMYKGIDELRPEDMNNAYSQCKVTLVKKAKAKGEEFVEPTGEPYYQNLAFERLGEIKTLAKENRDMKNALRWRSSLKETPEYEAGDIMIAYYSWEHKEYTFDIMGADVMANPDTAEKYFMLLAHLKETPAEWIWLPIPNPPQPVRVIDKMDVTHYALHADGSMGPGGILKESHIAYPVEMPVYYALNIGTCMKGEFYAVYTFTNMSDVVEHLGHGWLEMNVLNYFKNWNQNNFMHLSTATLAMRIPETAVDIDKIMEAIEPVKEDLKFIVCSTHEIADIISRQCAEKKMEIYVR